MQCPTCGAILPDGTGYCYSCGAQLPAPTVPSFPTGGEPYRGASWAELGGGQVPDTPSVSAGVAYPSVSPMSGEGGYVYGPSSNYPYTPGSVPGSTPPYFVPPITPAPRRKGRLVAITIIVSFMELLVIFGSVFVGIQVGQSHSGVTQTQAVTTIATPTTNATPDADQLYRQVTSRTPTFVDTLTNATLSQWAVYEKPTYGCEIKSDGLHAHIKDTGKFAFCTSGRGEFSTFAFQVSVRILSGKGGGITFRSDASGEDLYYFEISSGWKLCYLYRTEW